MCGQIKHAWANPDDPCYTTRVTLVAAIVKLMPVLMLQKMVPVPKGNNRMGYQPIHSSVNGMFNMMKTNNNLRDEALTQRALNDLNNTNICETSIVTINL